MFKICLVATLSIAAACSVAHAEVRGNRAIVSSPNKDAACAQATNEIKSKFPKNSPSPCQCGAVTSDWSCTVSAE
jgi:hypothetical protein